MSPALQARAADDAWFAAHPGRKVRLRAVAPGEWSDPTMAGDGVLAKLVYRFAPGKMSVWTVYVQSLLPDDEGELLDLVGRVMHRQGILPAEVLQ